MALDKVPVNFEGKGLSASFAWVRDSAAPILADAMGVSHTQFPRLIGVIYKTRAHTDGILLNFCPWCGARIRFDEADVGSLTGQAVPR